MGRRENGVYFDTAVCRVDEPDGIADQLSTPSEDQIHTGKSKGT